MVANTDTGKITKALADAIALHKAGDVHTAVKRYEKLLPIIPNHAELLYLLGAAYVHLKRSNDAVPLLKKSIAIRPKHVDTFEMLGSAWIKLQDPGNALTCFEQAVKLKPDSTDALCRFGTTLIMCNQPDDAIGAFRRARTINNNHPEAMNGEGLALHTIGQSAEGEAILRECIAANPLYEQSYVTLCSILKSTERFAAAEQIARQCLMFCPESVVAQHYLATALHKQGKLKDAERAYRKILKAGVSDTNIFIQLGDVLTDMGQLDEAENILTDAMIAAPDNAGLLTGLGCVEQMRGNLDNAISFHNRAIAANKSHVDTFVNRGNAHKFSGNFEAALVDYNKALTLNPNLPAAIANRGMTLLTLERLSEGWPAFRSRIRALAGSLDLSNHKTWDGSPLDGKNILVWAEYGLGDEILFSSLLTTLIEKVANCTFVCSPRLVALFKRTFPSISVHALGTVIEGDFDARLPLTDAAQWLRPSMESFPAHNGYIKADPDLTKNLRQRYQLSGDQKVIGISWHSAGAIGTAPFKSIALRRWAPILDNPGIRFVSLQYGNCAAEIHEVNNALSSRITLDTEIESSDEMDTFAAQVAAMDLVISISNTTVHIAGALGKPVWALVPKGPGAHWYWFQNRDDSPWYPSLRMFRQKKQGQWDETIGEVAEQLKLWHQK